MNRIVTVERGLYLKELRPTGRHPSPDTPPPGQEPKLRQQLSTPSMRSLGCFFVARAGLIDGPSLLRVPETFRPQVTLHTCVRAQTGGARRPTIIPKVSGPQGRKGFRLARLLQCQPCGQVRRQGKSVWSEKVKLSVADKVLCARVIPWIESNGLWAIAYPTANGNCVAELIGSREEARRYLSRRQRAKRSKMSRSHLADLVKSPFYYGRPTRSGAADEQR